MSVLPTFANLGDAVCTRQDPDHPALIYVEPDGTRSELSYGQMRRRIAQIAAAVSRRTTEGSVVAMIARNSANYYLAFMGIMYAGRIACPLSYKFKAETAEQLLADCDAVLVIHDDALALPDIDLPSLSLDAIVQESKDLDPAPAYQAGDEDLACIMYTSGSTGLPKGVPITHHGYLWALGVFSDTGAEAARKARTLIAAPMYHMNAQCTLLIASACGGTSIVLERFEASQFTHVTASEKVTELTGVPSMIAMMLNLIDDGAKVDLSSVDMISIGSAPLSDKLLKRIKNAFPGASLDNGYGTTETGIVAFAKHPDKPTPSNALGIAHPAIEMRLAGPNAPDQGELELKTGMMPKGYLNRPEATAERFKDGWYSTGDIMRCDADGFYYFMERADDMFVSGGNNIYPAEVEAILERHPDVRQAAVTGAPHPVKTMVPAAFVVLKDGTSVTVEDLKAFAIENGPAYAHPRHIVILEALPLAGTNKIDRNALADRAARMGSDG